MRIKDKLIIHHINKEQINTFVFDKNKEHNIKYFSLSNILV